MKFIKSWDALAVISLIAWHLGFFWQITLGQKFFAPVDMTLAFQPFRTELARAYAQGRLPLWTTELSSGFPIFADALIAALDPVNLFFYRVLPVPFAQSYSILFRFVWMAVGMYLFCRTLNLSPLSAWVAGFVSSFNGFTLAQVEHQTLSATAAWLPWLLFFQQRMAQARRDGKRTWIVWFAFAAFGVAFAILSGFPQAAIISLILFGAVCVMAPALWQRAEKFSLRSWAESAGLNVLILVFGAGVAAIQLLPTAELLNYSVRSGEMGIKFFLASSLAFEQLWQFIAPFDALGTPDFGNVEQWGYIGIAPLILGIVALVRRDTVAFFFTGVVLVAIVFALGGSTPVYPFLYNIPIFNRLRVPSRFLQLVVFAVSVLAAMGFNELQRRFSSRKIIQAAMLGILLWIVGDLAFFALPFFKNYRLTDYATLTATPRLFQVMDANALYRVYTTTFFDNLYPNRLILYGKASPQLYSSLTLQKHENYLAEMSRGMFSLMNARYVTRGSDPQMRDVWSKLSEVDLALLRRPAEFAPRRATALEITSFTDATQDLSDGFLAGEIIVDSREGITKTFPLRIGQETADWAYERFRAQGGSKHSLPARAIDFAGFHIAINRDFNAKKYVARYELGAAMDIVRVSARSLISNDRLYIEGGRLIDDTGKSISLAALAQRDDFSVVFKSHAYEVVENLDALPRAFIVHNAQILSDDDALGEMQERAFDPRTIAYLAEGEPLTALGAPGASVDRIEVREYWSERVELIAQSNSAGYLILSDTWYPGWVARVDGRTVPIYRADYIYRAVKLEPGEHTVEFEYQPESFRIGALVSAASLAILIGLVIWVSWRK